MPSIALNGLRVLDMSRVLAAPLATQMLADLGAEVVKIERPGVGDEARTYGPPFLKDRDGRDTDIAAFYLACNRNKRSVTLNHASAEGQALLRRLAQDSDVLVENFRTGTLAKYGLDYDSLRQVNPDLIYISVTGFGQTGPYKTKPGYDGIFQAMGGLMSVSGHPDEPMKVGISMVDILTSYHVVIAVLAALRHRDAGGGGQHVDLSLLDVGLSSLSHFAMSYLVSGEVPQRRGNGGFGGIPSQAFDCSDRPLFIVAGNDKQFTAFCKAAERPDLLADARFATTAARIRNREALLAELRTLFRSRTRDEWLALLDAHDIPASPVNELPEVLENPQIRHRGMLTRTEHPLAGELPLLANPIRFSATPVEGYAPPPLLGADTDAVLGERLGLDAGELARLREAGVI